MFDFPPRPTGLDYVYDPYLPGTIIEEEGSDFFDLNDAILLPEGRKFVLKDGFQNSNPNGSSYYFWLEPKGMEIAISFLLGALLFKKICE